MAGRRTENMEIHEESGISVAAAFSLLCGA